MSIWGTVKGFLFGNSEKGVIEQISDTADKWHPSKATRHKMSIENEKAGDSSQADARAMKLQRTDSDIPVVVVFNALVDGFSRLVRPFFTTWVFLLLTGVINPPVSWQTWPPMLWNIVWTILTFWFGSRLLFKDVPAMWKWYKNTKA